MSQAVYEKIIELLDREKADYTVLEHAPEGNCEAVSKLRASNLSEANKALVVRTKGATGKNYFLLALRADQKADFNKIGDYTDVRLCEPEKLEELTECVFGSIPPFSFNNDLNLIVDPILLKNVYFWFNAGLLEKSIRIKTDDFLRIVKPVVKDVSKIDVVFDY